jgi:hypothetical protein
MGCGIWREVRMADHASARPLALNRRKHLLTSEFGVKRE